MAKTSAKRLPAPVPVKATKTRLTKDMRETLHRYMAEEFRKRLDRSEIDRTLAALVERTNAILRAKYPEADMPVLRKYEMVRVDYCLRFTAPDTGRVFGVDYSHPTILPTEAKLADIPCRSGCYNRDVYPCDAEFEALADTWEKQIDARRTVIGNKEREYRGFVLACRYLEEVEAVVPLTEEIRKEIGAQGRCLTVINPDVLSRIKSDFAQGVAA
jgi:hypothetical protein